MDSEDPKVHMKMFRTSRLQENREGSSGACHRRGCQGPQEHAETGSDDPGRDGAGSEARGGADKFQHFTSRSDKAQTTTRDSRWTVVNGSRQGDARRVRKREASETFSRTLYTAFSRSRAEGRISRKPQRSDRRIHNRGSLPHARDKSHQHT